MGVPIYVLQSDSSDDSPSGWYRAKVTSYHCDGSCDLAYDNGDSEQSMDLYVVEWCYESRYHKVYHSSTQPSAPISVTAALPKICYSSLHNEAKGFDLTVMSSQSNDVKSAHQQVFIITKKEAIGICLEFPTTKMYLP